MITERIRRLRERRGYSQEEMADLLHISSSAYHRLENGETRLDMDRLKNIAEALGVDLPELLTCEPVVVNVSDQNSGANGCHNVVHQNGVSEDVLKAISDRYEAHVKELQQVNERLQQTNDRLTTLLEQFNGRLLDVMERLAKGK